LIALIINTHPGISDHSSDISIADTRSLISEPEEH